MKLSKLQKFILTVCHFSKQKKVPRQEFSKFYDFYKRKPKNEDIQNIITKSLNRLIKKDLLVGFGEVTRERIFISTVRLSRVGRREVRRVLDKQQRLPLRVKRQKSKKAKKQENN